MDDCIEAHVTVETVEEEHSDEYSEAEEEDKEEIDMFPGYLADKIAKIQAMQKQATIEEIEKIYREMLECKGVIWHNADEISDEEQEWFDAKMEEEEEHPKV